ncbi:uncharacterized protein LOC114356495 [Ostrinia furnacalis]|uniref:uncharacterized protein LOC114356495 n=1 Tax=Ostrinia furnacalis TaxID=93504 RepID=UPI00103BC6EB|nr:uncharacterized protein LOC114356495 [Ostrinia furnacalis]
MWLKVILLSVFGFTSSLTTSFDLGGVLSGNRMAGVPLGRSLGNGELDVEGICTAPGVACANCTLAVTCVPLPVGYLKVPLQSCNNGQTCDARLGQCSDTPVPECQKDSQEYEHTCEQVGIFPDAHDCRKFHLCSPPEGSPFGRPADHRTALCPRHFGYDPRTAQCSVKLEKGQCSEKPVPDCLFVGQNGPLPSSPNHYYVCLLKKDQLYPQVFLCPHGWYYWSEFCHPEPKVDESTTPGGLTDLRIAATEEIPTTTEVKKEVKEAKEVKDEAIPSWIDTFFSTEKATTYKADAFLADKYDLMNYESTDELMPPSYDFGNVYERSEEEFW